MLDLQTTQIGSLPYDDVEDAISFSMEHDIPFLPELPALGDAMLSYAQHPGRLSCLEAFWEATTAAPLVKVQSVGPVTLIQSGYTEDDALGAVYAHLDRILSGMASRPILFLDEPGLGYVGIDYEPLWEALFGAFDAEPGIHVCGNADWDRLFDAPITYISHDAATHDITSWPRYRRDKRVAWGVTSPTQIHDPRPGDLITAPCGMGTWQRDDPADHLRRIQNLPPGT